MNKAFLSLLCLFLVLPAVAAQSEPVDLVDFTDERPFEANIRLLLDSHKRVVILVDRIDHGEENRVDFAGIYHGSELLDLLSQNLSEFFDSEGTEYLQFLGVTVQFDVEQDLADARTATGLKVVGQDGALLFEAKVPPAHGFPESVTLHEGYLGLENGIAFGFYSWVHLWAAMPQPLRQPSFDEATTDYLSLVAPEPNGEPAGCDAGGRGTQSCSIGCGGSWGFFGVSFGVDSSCSASCGSTASNSNTNRYACCGCLGYRAYCYCVDTVLEVKRGHNGPLSN